MKNNKGFTLIELLVVIVILLGVTIIAIPNINVALNKKHEKEFEQEKETLIRYAEVFLSNNPTIYECIINGGYLSLNTLAEQKDIKLNNKNENHGNIGRLHQPKILHHV